MGHSESYLRILADMKHRISHASDYAKWADNKAQELIEAADKQKLEAIHSRKVETFYKKKLAVSQMLNLLSAWVKWPERYHSLEAMHDYTKRLYHVEKET